MSFLDELHEKWSKEDITEGRINLLKEGVITLVGVKRLESEGLFTSSEGIGTLRETAKVEFAGKERYWIIARKVNGVIRRVLLNSLKIEGCTVDEPCVECDVCGLLGALSAQAGKNIALFSRVKLQDLISLQEYVYDEKFRVKLNEEKIVSGEGTTPFQEVVVPPGTEFPFILRIFKPSKFDLGAILFGNETADSLGYGNYSKLRGDASTKWLLITNGLAYISVDNLLRGVDEGKSLEAQIQEFVEAPRGPVSDLIALDEAESVTKEIIKDFTDKYGITEAFSVKQG